MTVSYRLVVLTPFPPRLDAPMGGSRIIAQLLERLTHRHHVSLFYMRAAGEPPPDDSLLRSCTRAEEVARPLPAWERPTPGHLFARWCDLGQTSLGQLRGQPSWVTQWAVPGFGPRLRRHMDEWQPDLVQFEFHVMGQYARWLRGAHVPRILTQHEPGTPAAMEAREKGQKKGRFVPRLDVAAWGSYERAVLSEMDHIVVFTNRDRAATAELAPNAQISTVPFGISLPDRPLDPLGKEPKTLLFFGNYVHSPNVRAAFRLARGIFPRIVANCPSARLELIGPNMPAGIAELSSGSIDVKGFVEDLRPHLEDAALILAPLDTGGGMRVKIAEALAAGKAVVTSRRAVEGLPVADGTEVLLAETDEEFAAATLYLLANPEQRARLGRNAREFAENHLSWDAAVAAYERIYAGLVARQRAQW